jgi:hypothetical protein
MIFYIIIIIFLLYILFNIKENNNLECEFTDYNIQSKHIKKDDVCEYNSINNNLIVQRRIRREIDDFKNEKNKIKNRLEQKNKKKKKLEQMEVGNELAQEENNIIKKCIIDIKLKLKKIKLKHKTDDDNNLNILYAKKILNLLNNCKTIDILKKKEYEEILNEFLFLIQYN